jgi:DNA replication licensing factor MCM4
VSVKGIIIRNSDISPEMNTAAFKCSRCGFIVTETIDRNKAFEPGMCPNQECRQKGTFDICHEHCIFTARQYVKLQETPESVPEGEAPQTMQLMVHDDLVDQIKPGDRVEVCGIYRASGVRVNSEKRTQNSIFRTYVDVVIFVKADKKRFQVDVNKQDNPAAEEMRNQEEQNLNFTEQQINKFKAFSKDPELFEKLTNAIAPSIWEQSDVKKGVLC